MSNDTETVEATVFGYRVTPARQAKPVKITFSSADGILTIRAEAALSDHEKITGKQPRVDEFYTGQRDWSAVIALLESLPALREAATQRLLASLPPELQGLAAKRRNEE